MTESIKLGIPGLAVPQGKWCEVACTRGVHEAVVDEYLRVDFDRLKQHPAAESAPVVHAQQHREIRTAENTLYAALCVRNHAAYCIFCEWDTSP